MTNVTDDGTNVIPLDDTREQLEADIKKAVTYITSTAMWPPSANKKTEHVKTTFDEITEWLDRQDAITQRECIDRWDAKATLEIAELRAKVDELTAELEEARKRHIENEDQLAEENDVLIASVNELEASLDAAELDNEHLREELRRIEQLERDSAYMRLPVDTDGVPWRIGDKVQREDKDKPNVVTGILFYGDRSPELRVQEAACIAWTPPACKCRHVQPDTVESLLEEFYGKTHATTAEEREELAAEYAERIRRAVEHG